jgi:hypothetical protein
MSKASFIKQADRYCARFQQQFNDLIAQFGDLSLGDPTATYADPHLMRRWVRFLELDLRYLRAELDHIRALPQPDEDRETLQRFLGSLESAIGEGKIAQSAARHGDQSALSSHIDAGLSDFDREGSAAQAYGFQECGQF